MRDNTIDTRVGEVRKHLLAVFSQQRVVKMDTDEKIVAADTGSMHSGMQVGEVEMGKPDVTINASGHIQELERNFVS